MFEKRRDVRRMELESEYKKHKEETDLIEGDLKFLDGIEEKFDPVETYLDDRATKRAKTEEWFKTKNPGNK